MDATVWITSKTTQIKLNSVEMGWVLNDSLSLIGDAEIAQRHHENPEIKLYATPECYIYHGMIQLLSQSYKCAIHIHIWIHVNCRWEVTFDLVGDRHLFYHFAIFFTSNIIYHYMMENVKKFTSRKLYNVHYLIVYDTKVIP